MIGDILVALRLVGSSEPEAIKKRFSRMSSDLKAAAKRAT
jgi:hypothetical protein